MESLKAQARSGIEQNIERMKSIPVAQIRALRLAAIEGQAEFAASLGILPVSDADTLIVLARQAEEALRGN